MSDSTPSLMSLPLRPAPPLSGHWPAVSSSLPPDTVIFGHTPSMQAVRNQIEEAASTQAPVLIQGESGTGKELIARLIHAKSCRAGKFVPARSTASQLFGTETGASNGSKGGKLELANGGTLFVDEIADLDSVLQESFLQFLQGATNGADGGGANPINVRVVSSTSRDIELAIAEGTFRHDLFEQLSSIRLRLTPLRNRSVDIPDIAHYFVTVYSEKFKCHARRLSPAIIDNMQRYEWPGNIRQLESLMKWYVICGCEKVIEAELAALRTPGNYDVSLGGRFSLKKITREVVREVEGRIILEILQANHWNRRRTARALNISYRALSYKIKEAHLAPSGAAPELERE